MNNVRTVRVTGKGQLKLRPDTARITLSLEGLFPEYGEAIKKSAEDTECLKELLSGFGFGRADLKTLHFGVDTEYEGYDDNGIYRQRFAGYRFRHTLKVDFPADNDRLGRVLYALANSPVRPEFRLSYTVKDPEAAKNELLEKAVADAKEKAAVLARAAGVALGEIVRIDYAWNEIDLEVRPMALARKAANDGAAFTAGRYETDIEPEDIEAADTVTVLWAIG